MTEVALIDRNGKMGDENELDPAIHRKWLHDQGAIWALTKDVGLSVKPTNALYDISLEILALYLRQKQAREEDESYARSRELLASLTKRASAFVSDFERLSTSIRTRLIFARRDAPDVLSRDRLAYFDLIPELLDFAAAGEWLGERLPAKPIGNPGGGSLQTAVVRLTETIEHFSSHKVHFQRTRGSVEDPYFKGVAGCYIRDIFAVADPSIAENQLVNALRSYREAHRTKPKK